jgi:hypothetical protein
VQTEKRSKFLEDKLEATNDLVRTLVSELEKARRNNVDCNQGSQASKDRIGALEEQGGMSKDGEFSVMRRQYLHMKYAPFLFTRLDRLKSLWRRYILLVAARIHHLMVSCTS